MNQEELFRQIKNAATEDLRELIEFEGPYLRKFGSEERQINLAGFIVTVNEKVFGYAKSELAQRGELSSVWLDGSVSGLSMHKDIVTEEME